jgi:hypothetical protein
MRQRPTGTCTKYTRYPGGVDTKLPQARTQRTAVAWIAGLEAVQALKHSRLHYSITQSIKPVRKWSAAAGVLKDAELDGQALHECSL